MTAFELHFPTWPPPTAELKHGRSAQVGAVRLARDSSTKHQHREIKVRLDGPPARRWMALARFWWLKYRGPVPAGRIVAHIDGDTLNDDPSNYDVMTTGDLITCRHLDHPKWSERSHKRAAAATARANVDRASIVRALRWLDTRWYPVDLEAGIIHNSPHRARNALYRSLMGDLNTARNGRGIASAILGWPEYSTTQAAVLRSLQTGGPSTAAELHRRASELLTRYGFSPPATIDWLRNQLVRLRADQQIASVRCGRPRMMYRFTGTPRQLGSPLIAVRGVDLSRPEFAHFTRAVPAEVAA